VIGEIAIGGVFFPPLLLLGFAVLMLTALLTRLLQISGFYRYVAYRPLVDLSLFVILLGVAVLLSAPFGLQR